MPEITLRGFQVIWFGIMNFGFYVGVWIIAAAIAGYCFEWGRRRYLRHHGLAEEVRHLLLEGVRAEVREEVRE